MLYHIIIEHAFFHIVQPIIIFFMKMKKNLLDYSTNILLLLLLLFLLIDCRNTLVITPCLYIYILLWREHKRYKRKQIEQYIVFYLFSTAINFSPFSRSCAPPCAYSGVRRHRRCPSARK